MKEEEIELPKCILKRFFNNAYLYHLNRKEISSLNKKKK